MKHFVHQLAKALGAGALGVILLSGNCLGAAPAKAPTLATSFDINQNKTLGAQAFDAKDWQTAATKLEVALTAMKAAKVTENLPEILYMLGSANFNLNAFTKSADYLKEYETAFPTGEFINEVSVYLGWAYKLDKKLKEAIGQWEKLKTNEKVRGDILVPLAGAYEENAQPGEAMKVLEEYVKAGVKTLEQTAAAIQLVKLYLIGEKTEEAVKMLDTIKRSSNAADLILQINVQALQVADGLLEGDRPDLALRAYQSVRRKGEVLRVQKDRLEYMRGRMTELKRSKDKGAAIKISIGDQRIAMLSQHLTEVEKEESYDAVVIYRIARCFDKLKRYPEAELAFRHVYEKYPTFADRSTALFGQFIAYVQMNEGAEALEAGKKYLKEYPDGAQNEEVGKLLMTKLLENNQFAQGVDMAKQVIELMKDKDSPAARDIKFLKATAEFQDGRVDEAAISLAELQKNPPGDGVMKEQIDYMLGLTFFYKNEYSKALAALQEYLTKYPEGYFLDDAQYRLGIVMMGEERDRKNKTKNKESDYARVIAHATDILTKYPGTAIKGELYALIGDCYSELSAGESEKMFKQDENFDATYEAGKAYKKAAEGATNDEVLGYAIEMAKTKLTASGDWKAVREMYQNFVDSHKDHPDRLKGIRELSIAITRDLPAKPPEKTSEEWTEEFKKIRAARLEEVKAMLSKEALSNINRINAEGVEAVLTQLAVNCIPKPKPRTAVPPPTTPAPGAATTTTTTTATPPRKTPEEMMAEAKVAVDEAATEATKELEKWLPAPKLTPTGQARLLWAKSEIYRMLGGRKGGEHLVEKVAETLTKLSTDFNSEDYSAPLLAMVGDHLKVTGDKEKAISCYNRLKEFKGSDYLDFAYCGLGDISYDQKDYEGALKYYVDSVNKFPGMKYPFALLGQARCLIKLSRQEEARAPLLEIIPVKEWKGELTAEALFWMGVLEYQSKKYNESVNYFKNLYLSFQKFPNWTALGFINAIEVMYMQGKAASEVKPILESMLKNKRLLDSTDPEVAKLVQMARDGAPMKTELTFPAKLK